MDLMEMLLQLGLFSAKTLVIVIAVGALILLVAVLAAKSQDKPELEVEKLHKKYKLFGKVLRHATLTKEELKEEKKTQKKEAKEKKKEASRKVFVLDFNGDLRASAVDHLRQEVSAVLNVATPNDEVVVRLESPGGVVHGYGLAAAQLLRIRDKNIPLTVCVDKVAASGGYLISCTAHKILCAPFAIVGSIGVVAQIPNFHRVLKKHEVDYKEYTAGEFKRTVSLLGEITEKGEEKFKEQLEATHRLFKDFVHRNRPQLDVAKVATGEYWYGEDAKALGLVDGILTSDDYLLSQIPTSQIIKVSYTKKQKLAEKLSGVIGSAIQGGVLKIYEEFERKTLL